MTHNIKKVKTVQIKRTKYNDDPHLFKNEADHTPSMGHSVVSSNNLKQEQNPSRFSFKQQNPYQRKQTMGQPQPKGPQVRRQQSDEYSISQFEPHPNTPTYNPNITEDEQESFITVDDYLPNQIDFIPYFQSNQLQRDYDRNGEKKYLLVELFKAMTLCHSASRRKVPDKYSMSIYKSIYPDEEAQLMFASTYGYYFQSRQRKSIVIHNQINKERFDVIVNHTLQFQDQFISVIIVKPFQGQNGTIYAKGHLSCLIEFLIQGDLDQYHYFEDLKTFAQKGQTPIIFIKRELSLEETQEIESRINEAMSLVNDQEEKIEQSIMQVLYMQDFIPLGIIGTEEVFNFRGSLVVQDLIKNGIRIWMLSQDDEAIQTMNCNLMRIINEKSNPLIINGDTKKEVEEQIKLCLNVFTDGVTHQEQKMKYSSQHTEQYFLVGDQDTKQTLNDESIEGNNKKKKIQNQILMINGQSLSYILRDEALLKRFFTITSFCETIIGSSMDSKMKNELVHHLKQFKKDGTNTLALIGSTFEQQLINETDVSIALKTRYQNSNLLIKADVVMNDIYSLTYLLLKHGTICQRRMHEATKLIIYKTFFLAIILLYYQCIHAYSADLPIKQLMIIIFLLFVVPLQVILYGVTYSDFGYEYLHRIYGEYKRNFVLSPFSKYELLQSFLLAIFDAFIFYLVTYSRNILILVGQGRLLNSDGFQLYYGLILYICFTGQVFNRSVNFRFYTIPHCFINAVGMIVMLDDENLIGIKQLYWCPSIILYMIWVILMCSLRNYIMNVCRKIVIPQLKKNFEFYQNVEDKLFLEEYEDPDQEFCIDQFEQDHNSIHTKLSQKRMSTINQNLMKLPRSESLDNIIEKLNEQVTGQQSKKIHDSAILNWFTLKFNDQNKELEFMDYTLKGKFLKFRYILVLTLIFNVIEIIKDIILSALHYIKFDPFWFHFGYILIALITIFFTWRMKHLLKQANLFLLITLCLFYCFCFYYMENIEFSLFINIIIYLFSMHGIYIRAIILIAISFYILDINLVNSYFKKDEGVGFFNIKIEQFPDITLTFIAVMWIFYILCFSLFIFWEEKSRKLEFWIQQRKNKEFQKLKSILHILMPAFVIERDRKGQIFIADDQGDVTIVFCDIAEFDKIVQMFTGKELIEWLDNIYNCFDQLCEQHGLQKIETVGKTYMACGGLKECERNVDSRLLNKHHSVRSSEFAQDIIASIKKQFLKDGEPIKVKIGIHVGNVISGVVGKNKPQFSLIGDAVNKTSRVCSKCKENQILISRETYGILEKNTNMFKYEQVIVDMKGIGREEAYYQKKIRSSSHISKLQSPNRLERFQSASLRKVSQFVLNPQNQTNKPSKQEQQLKQQSGYKNKKHVKQQNQVAPYQYQEHDSSRSQNIYSDRSMDQPFELLNLSNDEQEQDQDSFSNNNAFYDKSLKDDRKIFQDQIENLKYNLVERPHYLLSFNQAQNHLEENFRLLNLRNEQWKKFTFLLAFFILNKIELAYFAVENRNLKWIPFFLYVFTPLLVISEIILILMIKYVTLGRLKLTHRYIALYFSAIMIVISLQSLKVSHNSRLIQIYLMEHMIVFSFIFFTGILQLRTQLLVYLSGSVAWLIVEVVNWDSLTVRTYSFVIELVYFVALHVYKSHSKEMVRRKMYNRSRIIEEEIKDKNELLSNLVPPPVLQGIKNDQKVVDELEDVTLLFTDMVGFTQFSNSVKSPQEVVELLSELFTRFDDLCVTNQVYKVHTIGDCYVILGYTGRIPQSERTPYIKAQEAFKVVQTGFEMIKIISDVRAQYEEKNNHNLRDLNMRIGIHTGKIVAGIIGSKIVRYDIFGGDVLIANKMESNGIQGQVVVSEYTKRIILSESEFSEKLDFYVHQTVELPLINKKVDSFIVKERQMTIGSNSSINEESDEDDDSDLDESISGSENEDDQSLRVQSNPPSGKSSPLHQAQQLEEEFKEVDKHQ